MIRSDIKCVCKDDISKIENYEQAINDKTQTWVCHHRLELTLEGEYAHSADELDRLGMYYNRPYFELIFLTPKEHYDLHKNAYNKPKRVLSEEQKQRIRTSHLGKHLTKEHKAKISLSSKNRTNEYRRKMSARMREVFNNKPIQPRSEFSIKFKEHFGVTNKEDPKLYNKERVYWHTHNHKCRWEI